MEISGVHPRLALPGGLVHLQVDGLPAGIPCVSVGDTPAEIAAFTDSSVSLRVPEGAGGEEVQLSCGGESAAVRLNVGRVLASDLNPVGNPLLDEAGNVFCTFSGARGETVPFSVYVISKAGTRDPFLADIMNASGLAFGPDGLLYVSSRHNGIVYRSSLDKRVEKFADGLGVATGIVFDSHGNLLVGDRNGLIYRVDPDQNTEVLCELEASVSAYHLAIDEADQLFVTGPTLASQDCVYRVTPKGEVDVLFKGFGRPQGLAVLKGGRLLVTASYRGRKGVFGLQDGRVDWLLSGPMLVGLALAEDGSSLALVDSNRLFRVDLSEPLM